MQLDKNEHLKKLFDIPGDKVIDPAQSMLMLELGEKYCCVAVMNRPGFEAQRLAYYEGDDEEELLQNIITGNDGFNAVFSDVLINYSFPESVMTPSPFYSFNDAKKTLHLLYGDKKEMDVLSEHLPEWQLYNVYEVPKAVHSWISLQFHSGKYWHHYTSSLMNFNSDHQEDVILIDFKTGQFSVIVIKSRQLQLVQTFAYTEATDVLYYLLKICATFSMSQRNVKLVLSGLIERQSTLYKELYSYFVDVSFKTNPPSLKLPFSFRQYPEHFFSSLFNLALCVS